MKIASLDRRLLRRLNFKTPLRVHIWKSTVPEESAESDRVRRCDAKTSSRGG